MSFVNLIRLLDRLQHSPFSGNLGKIKEGFPNMGFFKMTLVSVFDIGRL